MSRRVPAKLPDCAATVSTRPRLAAPHEAVAGQIVTGDIALGDRVARPGLGDGDRRWAGLDNSRADSGAPVGQAVGPAVGLALARARRQPLAWRRRCPPRPVPPGTARVRRGTSFARPATKPRLGVAGSTTFARYGRGRAAHRRARPPPGLGQKRPSFRRRREAPGRAAAPASLRRRLPSDRTNGGQRPRWPPRRRGRA